MTPDALDASRRLRHDLANPLAALLAEVQLLLLEDRDMDDETLNSIKEIEQLALRMRLLLRQAAAADATESGETIG